nr:phospholipase D delta-like [Ipomoea batatas]
MLRKTLERVGRGRRRGGRIAGYQKEERFDFSRGAYLERMASKTRGSNSKNRGVEGVCCWGNKAKRTLRQREGTGRVLGDIGNMVTLRGAEGKQQLPQRCLATSQGVFVYTTVLMHKLQQLTRTKKCIGAVNVDGFAAANGETALAVLLGLLYPNRSLLSGRPLLVDIGQEGVKEDRVGSLGWLITEGVMGNLKFMLDILRLCNLICGKNLAVDKSIETAYIQAIRSAQNFIYIENQYFLGSSYAWPSYEDAEGDPKTATMQEILFWQSQTMHMMYQVIAQEIKSMQLDEHHSDYLNFYCLGNREDVPSSVSQSISVLAYNQVSESLKFQRFMIYVHAKGMIVDGEYVIVGSANINQRSMAGSKDTEIAMGGYQPHHTWARKQRRPHGQVQTV